MEGLEQKVVLIIDDDRPLVEVYRAALEIEGYKVVAKYDGEDGLRWLSGSYPDVLILDCLLPKFGGFSILETLRADRERKFKAPVIMVTGLDRPEYRKKAEDLGAVEYLVKSSASISEMVDVVNESLDSKKRRKLRED